MAPSSSGRSAGAAAVLAICFTSLVVAATAALPHPAGDGDSSRVVARQAGAGAALPSAGTQHAAPATFVRGTAATAGGASINVSASFPDAADRARRWAEFFSVLPHGDELDRVTINVVTAAELPDACRAEALGCYRPGLLSFADEVVDGVTAEEVARHEYGHHVAANRLNSPWAAIDWGPKRWATAAGICADVKDGTAFPGDEGDHYAENSGEAWAEVYRILAERTAGLPGNLWSIVVGRYYPDDAALAAAREDVLHPWTGPATRRYSGQFVKGGTRVWQRPLATALDGSITVRLSYPAGPRHDVALLTADGRTVIARWTGFTSRTRTISTSICGRRSVLLRVTRGTAPGPFAVAVTAP